MDESGHPCDVQGCGLLASFDRDQLERLRGRNTSAEAFSRRNNAGTPDDHAELFSAYADAGASHSIVALPDVHLDGSIEAFGDVIAHFAPR